MKYMIEIGTDSNFEELVLKSDRLVLVDFWAEWCQPCLYLSPIIEKIAEEYKDEIKVVKMNVDYTFIIPQKYGISSIPTILFFKNGEVVDKIIGAVPKELIVSKIKKHLKGGGEMGEHLEVTDTEFEEKVLKADKPVLVDFWAEWCMPCLMIAPYVEEIADKYKDKIYVYKLNVDDNPAVPQKYGIISIPTLLFFKNGEVVDKIIGAVPKNIIEEKVNSITG